MQDTTIDPISTLRSTKDCPIVFHRDQKWFLLRMDSAFYAMRVTPEGHLVHVGSGTLPANLAHCGLDEELWFDRLDDYEEYNYVWNNQGRCFELPCFGDVNYVESALKVSFPQTAGPLESGDAANLPVRDLRLRYVSHDILHDAAPGLAPAHGLPTRGPSRATLCVMLKDEQYDFFTKLFYRVSPAQNIIERWVELENCTCMTVPVHRLCFATMNLPPGKWEMTHAAGVWAREFATQRTPLDQGTFVMDNRGLNTGHNHNPFYLINETAAASEKNGKVHFGALAFSGNWSLQFESLFNQTVRVHGGYEPGDLSMPLAPGQKHATPAMILGWCEGGWGQASRHLHDFAREFVLPGAAPQPCRPVLYNSWEATYFDVQVENQIELARKAAAIGVELFCVDDGWFGARRHDRAGLGDWVVSPAAFPNGLKPLIDEVKKLGMKFGLWVEPEMVNPDSDLYRAHPDWVLHFPGRPRTEMRQQLILDFGREEVVQFIGDALEKLLRENAIDFFKWDMNRFATEPGSVAGQTIGHRHAAAVYRIMDRLRKNFPHLSIQSCSGGGGRVDLGMLARADQVWTSDNTDAFDRAIIQDGYSLAYPTRAMECWVTHEKNHQTGRRASLDLRFDMAMRGALGIGSSLNQLGEEELARYQRKIAFYKRIRPVVQEGNLHRLALAAEGGTSIWLSVLRDGSQAVYSSVTITQLQGVFRAPPVLCGLVPEAIYRVLDEHDTELARYHGAQLMTLGLPNDPTKGGFGCTVRSKTLWLVRAD